MKQVMPCIWNCEPVRSLRAISERQGSESSCLQGVFTLAKGLYNKGEVEEAEEEYVELLESGEDSAEGLGRDRPIDRRGGGVFLYRKESSCIPLANQL